MTLPNETYLEIIRYLNVYDSKNLLMLSSKMCNIVISHISRQLELFSLKSMTLYSLIDRAIKDLEGADVVIWPKFCFVGLEIWTRFWKSQMMLLDCSNGFSRPMVLREKSGMKLLLPHRLVDLCATSRMFDRFITYFQRTAWSFETMKRAASGTEQDDLKFANKIAKLAQSDAGDSTRAQVSEFSNLEYRQDAIEGFPSSNASTEPYIDVEALNPANNEDAEHQEDREEDRPANDSSDDANERADDNQRRSTAYVRHD
uniref:F-box domain-containing protein n=1 Tax=Ditylenchus dipsaci TaxID=166011 RepID=A0A915DN26_9BILA